MSKHVVTIAQKMRNYVIKSVISYRKYVKGIPNCVFNGNNMRKMMIMVSVDVIVTKMMVKVMIRMTMTTREGEKLMMMNLCLNPQGVGSPLPLLPHHRRPLPFPRPPPPIRHSCSTFLGGWKDAGGAGVMEGGGRLPSREIKSFRFLLFPVFYLSFISVLPFYLCFDFFYMTAGSRYWFHCPNRPKLWPV